MALNTRGKFNSATTSLNVPSNYTPMVNTARQSRSSGRGVIPLYNNPAPKNPMIPENDPYKVINHAQARLGAVIVTGKQIGRAHV